MSFKVIIESIDSNEEDVYKKTTFNSYIKAIKSLMPLFSVSSSKLPQRLLSSLAPPFLFPQFRRVYSDLKVPLLINITLFFILFIGLHTYERSVWYDFWITFKLTFFYWLFFSILGFFLGYFCETCLTFTQYLSISGYSLSGHCLVLLLAEIFHQEESISFFIIFMTIFGGLATGRLIVVVMSRTPKPVQRMLICTCLACLHLLHLIYIHFAFMRKKFVLD